jgi:hypothetical protein
MTDQSEAELNIFRRFAGMAGLPIVQQSVVKRPPPEPDVLCRTNDGEQIAFELVEICNPANARLMASSHQMHRLIMAAYEGLPRHIREAFDARFVHKPLSFSFRKEASLGAIRRVLPRLLVELTTSCARDEYADFSPKVAAVVDAVRERGRPNDLDQVNLSLGGTFDPVAPLDAVIAKLSKTYESAFPIELLAYFGAYAWGTDSSYRGLLDALRQGGLGPFRRLWVMEWYVIGFVYPPREATQ